jgi:predicted nucleotidyltransferase component of viral defense system
MNNIIANYLHILNFAKEYGLPGNKTRGIIREYLQSLFISRLYQDPASAKLSFIGGTSLRLLRNIPRFSEDLDFDVLGLSNEEVVQLIKKTVAIFERENIAIELNTTLKGAKTYCNLKFPMLLSALKISTNPKEKLMIKVDFTSNWKGVRTETVLFSRYGVIEQVVTNLLDQLLVQKLTAYINRQQTQPRDIYDVVWLYAQGARVDWQFVEVNGLDNLIETAERKLATEAISNIMKLRLQPFLFEEMEINKLHLFGDVLKKLRK